MGWFEAHTENYFGAGGTHLRYLEKVRSNYELSLHGVGLSIGSTDPLNVAHLSDIARLVRAFSPMLVSEHLSWSSVGGRFSNDLLPLPYTEEALRHMIVRVADVQDALERQILIENVSSYLQFTCSQMPEWAFLNELARESGCAILLDVNNVYVSAMNHGFDPYAYLDAIPRHLVKEIHLAGHTVCQVGQREVRIDTHNSPVCPAVWELYAAATGRFPAAPALIEWDADIPELSVLVAEAHKADQIAGAGHAVAA